MIYITQCKCPHDHCIVALAWDGESSTQEENERVLANQIAAAIAAHLINPWCALCNSREFSYSSRVTPWKTLEEAAPHLYEAERQQMITGAVLGPINDAKRRAGN